MTALQAQLETASALCRDRESAISRLEAELNREKDSVADAKSAAASELERVQKMLRLAQKDVADLRVQLRESESQLADEQSAAQQQSQGADRQSKEDLARANKELSAQKLEAERLRTAQRSMLDLFGEYRKCRYNTDDEDSKEPPTTEEVEEYAQYLNFDIEAHPELEWLAEEAIDAPLPANWSTHLDGTQNVFYFNATTEASSYEHPYDKEYQKIYSVLSQLTQPG
eukprot:SAG22_NODE_246_length_13948_cov_12.055744_10_plen_227_part_00